MIYYLTYLRDSIGNNYLGIKLPNGTVEPFLKELKDLIGESDYEEFTGYQQKRDNGQHHITVINVMDYNNLAKESGISNFVNSLDKVFKYEIDDIKMMGVGTAERGSNRTYFIVCKSDKLDAIRNRYNLPQHDFHVTLGFKHRDVFGVRKNEVLKKKDKFKQLLSQSFYKNENWIFLRRIENFTLDPNAEIIPISISETTAKFKVENYYIEIGYLDDGEKFWIMAKYPVNKYLPRLSLTEITKLLK
jgi:hypothetical protein